MSCCNPSGRFGTQLLSLSGSLICISDRGLSRIRLKLDLPVEVPQKPRLTRQNLRATRGTMTRQNIKRLQRQRLVENIGPVRNIRIQQLIPRPIDRRVPRTQHPFLRQPHIPIARRMPPPQKKKFDLTHLVLQHEPIAVDDLPRPLNIALA